MKILFVGDVVGNPGRRAVREILPRVVKESGAGFVIANAENVSGGSGIVPENARELLNLGIDVLTSGNHIWSKKEVFSFIDDEPRLLRPANYPSEQPGRGWAVLGARGGGDVAVLNLVGRVFMGLADDPFRIGAAAVARLRERTPVVIVDVHAEASSEKRALGWSLDGKVTAVLGTHTHVQTADEEILPNGTAYITDVGMTGPFQSVIGVKIEQSVRRFTTGLPSHYEPASKDVRLQAVLLEADPATGRALAIERITRRIKD